MRSTPWLVLLLTAAWSSPPSVAADAPAGSCRDVPELAEAAALLLLSGDPARPGAVDAALREAGSDLMGGEALWLAPGASDGERAGWLRRLGEASDAPLACGEAHAPDGRLLVAVSLAGGLAPVDPEALVVRGWLAEGFEHPVLSIVDADGVPTRLELTASTLSDGVPLSTELPRPLTVQLLAEGSAGVRPVAQRHVFAADSTPARPAPAANEGATGGAVDGELNRLRQQAGRRPVRRNRLLREVARRHAHAVCERGRVGHLSVDGIDPEERLLRAGIEARIVGETVGRAPEPDRAFAAFTRSASHLSTLLDTRFTDAGVAFDRGRDGRACVVVLLAAWPRFRGRVAGQWAAVRAAR